MILDEAATGDAGTDRPALHADPDPPPGSDVEVYSPDGDANGGRPGGGGPHPSPRPAPFVSRRGEGFADPSLLAGRSLRIWVYVVALLLAAAADVANFNQIIQFVIRDQQDLLWLSADVLLLITVAGFTACVLFLAHIAGVMLRERRARETWVPAILPWLCLLVWVGLGACGLYLRLTSDTAPASHSPIAIAGQPTPSASPNLSPTASAGASPSQESAPAASETTSGSTAGAGDTFNQLGASMIFLGLYLGTGLVAVVGGYLTHNPAYAALRRVRRRYDGAVSAAATAAHGHVLAQGEVERLEQLERHAELITRADQIELQYQGEVLKMEARLRAAQHNQDPAFTDAWIPPPTTPSQPSS